MPSVVGADGETSLASCSSPSCGGRYCGAATTTAVVHIRVSGVRYACTMQRLDGRLVLSPTDLTHHQECAHLTRLDLGVAAGEWARPEVETPEEVQFVFDRGLEHEERYLASLVASGKTVVEIEAASGAEGRRRAEDQTLAAMRRGVDVVYQGTFFDGAW